MSESQLEKNWKKLNKARPELIHHGDVSGEFTIRSLDTDYFAFEHKCGEAAEVKALLIDNTGRIIFNLVCNTCKKADAVKTTKRVPLGMDKNLDFIHLSPKLAIRVGRHKWDDL